MKNFIVRDIGNARSCVVFVEVVLPMPDNDLPKASGSRAL